MHYQVLIGLLLAVGCTSTVFAQSSTDTGATRAQVKQELRLIEKAGFDPTDTVGYPKNLVAAQKVLSDDNATACGDRHALQAGLTSAQLTN